MNYSLFLSTTDISDILMSLAKMLQISNQNVLIVDHTAEQFLCSNVPLLQTGNSYSEFDGIDIHHMPEDTFASESLKDSYDHIIIYYSHLGFHKTYPNWRSFQNKFVVLSPELSQLNKTTQMMDSIFNEENDKEKAEFIRLFINQVNGFIGESYFEQILKNYPIRWKDEPLALLFEEQNYIQRIVNQNSNRVDITKYSKDYKDYISQLFSIIAEKEPKEIKALLRKIGGRKRTWGVS